MTRPYDRTRRAAAAAETTTRIVDAAENLLANAPLGALTLQAVAAGAGVTVQTVMRHMGGRDGCIDAVRARVVARIDGHRLAAAEGDVGAALSGLLRHYEADGRLILHLLAQAPHEPWALDAVEQGRAYHRAWVLRSFGPHLPSPAPERRVDALVAATDLYVWRLLRLDLGRSAADTAAVIETLTLAVLEPR